VIPPQSSLLALLLALPLASACGSSVAADGLDDTSTSSGTSSGGDDSGSATGGGENSGEEAGDTGGEESGETGDDEGGATTGGQGDDEPGECFATCQVDADCVIPPPPGFPGEPMGPPCVDGLCDESTPGCTSDEDCDPDIAPLCVVETGQCEIPCSVDLDCTLPIPFPGDLNLYCDEGICEDAGCLSDAECDAGEACPMDGRPCTTTCDTPVDCEGSWPLHDAENYLCKDNLCLWLGCTDDSQCFGYTEGNDGVCL
jgi:hypothetical protein